MMGWLILVLLLMVIIGLIAWFSRRPSGNTRRKIHGQICPKCGSKDISWAGYADRKECAKCGKIFG
jgi:ribosomal protein S27AE